MIVPYSKRLLLPRPSPYLLAIASSLMHRLAIIAYFKIQNTENTLYSGMFPLTLPRCVANLGLQRGTDKYCKIIFFLSENT